MSLAGIFIVSPLSTLVILRLFIASDTAFFICFFKRERNRWRFTALLFLPFSRLSMILVAIEPLIMKIYARVNTTHIIIALAFRCTLSPSCVLQNLDVSAFLPQMSWD